MIMMDLPSALANLCMDKQTCQKTVQNVKVTPFFYSPPVDTPVSCRRWKKLFDVEFLALGT
jgi:hypothetical protein